MLGRKCWFKPLACESKARDLYILPLSHLLFLYSRTYGSRTADSRRVKRIPALRTHVEDGQSQSPRTSLVALPYFYRKAKRRNFARFPIPLAFRGPWFKKQTKIQKSEAVASPTQDRALILRKRRAVKFSTCPLNAPVRGGGQGVGWVVHPNILYV